MTTELPYHQDVSSHLTDSRLSELQGAEMGNNYVDSLSEELAFAIAFEKMNFERLEFVLNQSKFIADNAYKALKTLSNLDFVRVCFFIL